MQKNRVVCCELGSVFLANPQHKSQTSPSKNVVMYASMSYMDLSFSVWDPACDGTFQLPCSQKAKIAWIDLK